MTTARDVTILNYIAYWWTRTVSPDVPNVNPKLAAESIRGMLLAAPDSVRLELATKLLPEPYFITRMVNRPRQPFVFDDELPASPSEDE